MNSRTRTKNARPARAPAMPRKQSTGGSTTAETTSKLDMIVSLLTRPDGASLDELTAATGWQAHSVRGALAGSLKKKGHRIGSQKIDGARRYRIGAARKA